MVKAILDYIKELSLCELVIISLAITMVFIVFKCKAYKAVKKPKEDKEDEKEGFCTCQGMETMVCSNPQTLQMLYNKGILTENTDLTKYQDLSSWKSVAPYDQFYQYDKKYNSCGTVIQ